MQGSKRDDRVATSAFVEHWSDVKGTVISEKRRHGEWLDTMGYTPWVFRVKLKNYGEPEGPPPPPPVPPAAVSQRASSTPRTTRSPTSNTSTGGTSRMQAFFKSMGLGPQGTPPKAPTAHGAKPGSPVAKHHQPHLHVLKRCNSESERDTDDVHTLHHVPGAIMAEEIVHVSACWLLASQF